MYAKRIRRKCSVRGCRSIDTYSIAKSKEAGNSVIICKSCLEDALKSIKNPVQDKDPRVAPQDVPPLYPTAVPKTASEEATEPTQAEVVVEPTQDAEVPPTDASEFVCPHCGQVCKSELGLQKHIAAKHKDLA